MKNIARIITILIYLGYIFFLLFIIDDVQMNENIKTAVKNIEGYDTIVRVVPASDKTTINFLNNYKQNKDKINNQYNIENILYMIHDINVFSTSDEFKVDAENSLSEKYQTLPAYTINNEYLKAYPLHLGPFTTVNSLGQDEIIIPHQYKQTYPIGSKINISNGNIEGTYIVSKQYTVVDYTTRFSNIVSLNDYAQEISLNDTFILPLPTLSDLRQSSLTADYYNTTYSLGAFINTDEEFVEKIKTLSDSNNYTILNTTTYIRDGSKDLANYQNNILPKYMLAALIMTFCLLLISIFNLLIQREKYSFYIYHGVTIKKLIAQNIKTTAITAILIGIIAIIIDYMVIPLFIDYYIPFSLSKILIAILLLIITNLLFQTIGFKLLMKRPNSLLPKEKK